MDRSSTKSAFDRSSLPWSTVEWKYTQRTLWRAEISMTSAASTVPLIRTSPTAIELIVDVLVSAIRSAVR